MWRRWMPIVVGLVVLAGSVVAVRSASDQPAQPARQADEVTDQQTATLAMPVAEPDCPRGFAPIDGQRDSCERFELAVASDPRCPEGSRGEPGACWIMVADSNWVHCGSDELVKVGDECWVRSADETCTDGVQTRLGCAIAQPCADGQVRYLNSCVTDQEVGPYPCEGDFVVGDDGGCFVFFAPTSFDENGEIECDVGFAITPDGSCVIAADVVFSAKDLQLCHQPNWREGWISGRPGEACREFVADAHETYDCPDPASELVQDRCRFTQ